MTKRTYLAEWLEGDGIEIGALHSPLAVPAKARVRYVDRMDVPSLRAQYPELADKDLVPVSIISDGEDLSALADSSQDFVIASHLIEHLPNPTKGLLEMARVLRPGGVLYLAVPDPRVTFDRDRALTTNEHLLEEWRNGSAGTRRWHFEDWVDSFAEARVGEETREECIERLMAMDFSIHYHVWLPDTFLGYLATLRAELGLELELAAFAGCYPGLDNEYIFILLKGIAPEPPRHRPDGGLDPWVETMQLHVELERLDRRLADLREREHQVSERLGDHRQRASDRLVDALERRARGLLPKRVRTSLRRSLLPPPRD